MNTMFGLHLKDKLIKLGIATPDTINGCTTEEIENVKLRQGVKFLPDVYRQFLNEMGHQAGKLYYGSDYSYKAILSLKVDIQHDLEFFERNFKLPEGAVIFLSHQGYVFWYFDTTNEENDPPVYRFSDDVEAPIMVKEKLSEFFEQSVDELHRQIPANFG